MSTASSTAASGSTYVLGHNDVEVQRLLPQGRLYNDYTEHALMLAGLRPGMRVLDVGCGPGDVAIIAARPVGPTGTVLGVDAAPEMIELARARASEQGLAAVHFKQAAIDALADIANCVPRFRQEALAVNALITMPPIITARARVQEADTIDDRAPSDHCYELPEPKEQR
jgi:tRNA A58 N-methylase Trm61